MAAPIISVAKTPLVRRDLHLARTLAHVTVLFEHEGRPVGLRGVFVLDAPYVLFTVEDGIQLPRRRTTRTPVALPVTLLYEGEESPGATVNIAADEMSKDLTT